MSLFLATFPQENPQEMGEFVSYTKVSAFLWAHVAYTPIRL